MGNSICANWDEKRKIWGDNKPNFTPTLDEGRCMANFVSPFQTTFTSLDCGRKNRHTKKESQPIHLRIEPKTLLLGAQ